MQKLNAFILIFILSTLFSFACKNQTFDVMLQDYPISVSEILEEFSKACYFSVIYDDSTIKERLDKKLSYVNFKDKDLDYIFALLFDATNLHYSFNDDILTLKTIATKTFKVNYLSTNRQGISNTSVSTNNEENDDFLKNEKNNISQSGIHITSEDGFNFWDSIANEILAIIGAKKEENRIIVNKGAGLISVKGDRKSLQKVESYIKKLHSRLQKQVLIDIQILSVRHNNTQTMGINWDSLYNLQNLVLPSATEGATFGGEDSGNISGLNFTNLNGESTLNYGINIFSQGLNLERVIEFLKGYGEVSSISNPKVLTLNNQPALISVGDILRYKKSNIYQNTNAQTTLTNTDNEYPSIFAGVLLDITPLVFDDFIMLKVNPSITRTKDTQTKTTSIAFDAPPNLTTNQLSSIVKVKNNQKVILGGLIAKNFAHTENKIPILGDIPLIAPLFSYEKMQDLAEEIVFIIEPKIIEDSMLSLEHLGYQILKE